jgi:hypothetical protein
MSLFSRKTKSVGKPKTCPACGEPLGEHVQADIGSAPIGSEREEQLKQLITARKWGEARAYQAANANADIRVWRMIRCGDGRVGVVSLVMPIEMWSDDYYEEPQFLSGDERDALTAAVPQLAAQPH